MMTALEPVKALEERYAAAEGEIAALERRIKDAEGEWQTAVLNGDPKSEGGREVGAAKLTVILETLAKTVGAANVEVARTVREQIYAPRGNLARQRVVLHRRHCHESTELWLQRVDHFTKARVHGPRFAVARCLPNALAITCGAKCRQVHRLVGQFRVRRA